MTQADGDLPTVAELRDVLGRAKIEWADYERAVTSAAAKWEKATNAERWEIMADLTAKHDSLSTHITAVHDVLGLPYDPIMQTVEIEVDVFAVIA